jgi:hypothetical protein
MDARWHRLKPLERFSASCFLAASRRDELGFYRCYFWQPLVGCGMLSAARYPIRTVWIAAPFPHSSAHPYVVRDAADKAHHSSPTLLFLMFLAYFGAILFHTLIVRARDVQPHGAVESSVQRASRQQRLGDHAPVK